MVPTLRPKAPARGPHAAGLRTAVQLVCLLTAGCAATAPKPADTAPHTVSTAKVDSSVTSRALQQLPAKPRAERVAVAIHRFRSSVPEIPGASATDMFTSALVESNQFRVLERAQLKGGVIAEKKLNATGQTQGATAQVQLIDAQYIFEGTVSEANTDEAVNQGGVTAGPLSAGGSSSRSSVVIDVRVVAVATGEVVDAVTVRKPVYSRNVSASIGTGAPVTATSAIAAATDAVPTGRTPVGAGVSAARRDGVGRALRACIEVAVLQLSKRSRLDGSDAAVSEKAQ